MRYEEFKSGISLTRTDITKFLFYPFSAFQEFCPEAILVDEISTKVRIYPPKVILGDRFPQEWYYVLFFAKCHESPVRAFIKKTPISVRRCQGG